MGTTSPGAAGPGGTTSAPTPRPSTPGTRPAPGPYRMPGLDPLADQLEKAGGAAAPARLLVVAGRPLREPVARYGPFVMNTDAEIEQAFADFRSGTMGAITR